MKRVLWMVLLTLALPLAAFAGDVDFSSQSGTLTGNSSMMTLSGTETINTIKGLGSGPLGTASSDLATVSFTTGALTQVGTSNVWTIASGGSFTVTADTNLPGIASGTTIFSGQFSCSATNPCTWTLAGNANGTNVYFLSGHVSGTWYTGTTVQGFTFNTVLNSGQGIFDGGTGSIVSGDTTFLTPEPGSLMLMGTGLVGLGGALRRKLKA